MPLIGHFGKVTAFAAFAVFRGTYLDAAFALSDAIYELDQEAKM